MNSNKWIRQIFVALLISLLTVSVAVADSPLTQPKADGLIGEQADGYLGLVSQNAPADIKKLVNEVNAKRKAGYQEIAAKAGYEPHRGRKGRWQYRHREDPSR